MVLSWTKKKAEHQRIDTFELWCWRRLLRVPWTARRSKQSILKEISPEYLLEGLMLKLKLQYFGHLIQRANSLEKTLMLEKIEGRRRRGRQRMRWLDGITDSMTWVWVNSRSWWWTGRPGMLAVHGVAKSQTRLSDWTDWQLQSSSSETLPREEADFKNRELWSTSPNNWLYLEQNMQKFKTKSTSWNRKFWW